MQINSLKTSVIEADPINIASEVCDLCGSCVGVCPPDCIIMTERNLNIIGEICIRCGICLMVCPVGALTWNNGHIKDVQAIGGGGIGR